MNKKQREAKITQMLPKIRSDFDKILQLAKSPSVVDRKIIASRDYLNRQIGKYLKPLDKSEANFALEVNYLMVALQSPPLLNAANNLGALPVKKPNWDTEGDGVDHVPIMLQIGFGWSGRGNLGGKRIRMNQKAFVMLPELTLRGVMVHEASHFSLSTKDIYYETFTRHSKMQALANGKNNADNWRIFYQKISKHFAEGSVEED